MNSCSIPSRLLRALFLGVRVHDARRGIPARVVTGYQGGELNPVDQIISVRQSDAPRLGGGVPEGPRLGFESIRPPPRCRAASSPAWRARCPRASRCR